MEGPSASPFPASLIPGGLGKGAANTKGEESRPRETTNLTMKIVYATQDAVSSDCRRRVRFLGTDRRKKQMCLFGRGGRARVRLGMGADTAYTAAAHDENVCATAVYA